MTTYEICTLAVAGLSVVVAAVVAVATKALVNVTNILAVETARMATAMSTAHVVVTLQPHAVALHLVEVVIENTGTATAYDIQIEQKLSPPQLTDSHEIPFRKISILKPHESLKSCMLSNNFEGSSLSEVKEILNCTFTVTISWSHSPGDNKRYSHTYDLSATNFGDIGNIELPLVSISNSLSNIESSLKELHSLTALNRRINVDVFDANDRQAERKERITNWINRNKRHSRR